ncbi:hypothetical protein BH10PLA2_BH10PLA2_37360 [soil metagenome]
MFCQLRILPVAFCLLGLACSPGEGPHDPRHSIGQETKNDQVDALIKQLGHDKFALREEASKELRTIGQPALNALRQAAKAHDSAEIRRRADQLVQVLEAREVRLMSAHFSPGLKLAESPHPVCMIRITAQVNAKGEGKGTINLVTTPPNYDEFGDIVTGRETDNKVRPPRKELPTVSLDCSFEYLTTGAIGRVNEGATNRSVFRIKGPKITSALSFATSGPGLTSGRLLVHGSDRRVEHVVEFNDITPRMGQGGGLPVPCHPGCFPAGTMVRVPDGVKPIDQIRAGDLVIAVNADGTWAYVKVTDVSVTRNLLLEVQTEAGTLITTQTQPIALQAGGFKGAADLKKGDRILRIVNGERRAVAVLDVTATNREADVYNLVLGETRNFTANDFLVRSKPPGN